MTDLDRWLQRLESQNTETIRLGLERVGEVFERLQANLGGTVITVAGTNGKGSVCAMLEAILLASGYSVGLYTSPHLLRYTERVRLNGREVDEQTLVAAFESVESARGETPLTYFEQGTLAAWKVFCDAAPEVVILEVGLGGRLDAVNIVDADCAIVTSVAMDHMEYLGDTRDKIGFEKAGVFRAGRPAICGDPMPPESLLAHAEAIGASLWISGRDFGFGGDRQQWGYWRYEAPGSAGGLVKRGGLAYPALRGANQLLNAASVLTALELLRDRIPVSMQAVRQGLMLVDLPGRFQVLPGRPTVVLDVAHNPQAAGVLAENLSNMGFYPDTWCVIGMLADKDVEQVAALLRGRIDHWYVASLQGARGLDYADLAGRLRAVGVDPEACFDSPAQAFDAARKAASESDRILVFGSFMTVADVLGFLEDEGKKNARG
ncbi:MAG TPA: bifunctional tetrahydrofolate synthase/dihydrofolate synthase [Azoarcus taiwanensis]|nr:bifunctional tetrahydrofolate synthase/dihydrofolate synthase [Azoarcus taiwanensis]